MRTAPVKLAPVKLEPFTAAPVRLAPVNVAPVRLKPVSIEPVSVAQHFRNRARHRDVPLDVVIEQLLHGLFALRVEGIRGRNHDGAADQIERHDQPSERQRIRQHFYNLPIHVVAIKRDVSELRAIQNSAQQRLDGLTQDGWHVAYGGYVDAHGQTLPARLTLERETVRVRLVVDDWQL